MNCPNCDFKNPDGMAICGWCRKPLPRAALAPVKQLPPPPVAQQKPRRRTLREVKPPEPGQIKYLAVIGVLIAVIVNETFSNAHSGDIEKVFGRGTFTAVRILTDLIAAVIGYYNSYKLAAEPRLGNSLKRGALSGLFIGIAAGASSGPAPDAAFSALLGLPLGALCGLLNLRVIHAFTVEREKAPLTATAPSGSPEPDGARASYSQFYALIGGVFGALANYLFLIPWQNEMHGRYDEVLSATTLLCGGIGLYFGMKIAKTGSANKAMHFGAAGGALIGVVNGTAVFPVIGTVIGGVLGALIGAFVGGPLAFYLIKVSRWVLLDDGKDKTAGKGDEKA